MLLETVKEDFLKGSCETTRCETRGGAGWEVSVATGRTPLHGAAYNQGENLVLIMSLITG